MLTIVVPTMWRYAPFVEFLRSLTEVSCVDQIIVINNDKERMPAYRPQHEKIEYIDNEYNIFVNPAFNLGVQQARNQNVCIINDDVIFDSRILYYGEHFMDITPTCGVLGISVGEEKYQQPGFKDGTIDFVKWDPDQQPAMFFGFCMLFFVRKSEWLPIPQGLNIYFGDDWVVRTQKLFNREIYSITNCFFYTPFSQTCSTIELPPDTLPREQRIYDQAMNELINEKGYKMIPQTNIAPEYPADILRKQPADEVSISEFNPSNITQLIGDPKAVGDSSTHIIIEGINRDNIGDMSYYIFTFLAAMYDHQNWVVRNFYYRHDGLATVIIG